MDIETITYDNYTFKIELDKDQIKLNMTDNTLMEIYEGTVKEDELYIKPIKKFYSMINRALNKEISFNFSIDNRNSKMVCTVSYSTDMIDLEEHIILNKISASESRELLLVRRVKELEDLLTPVFGYKYDDELGLKYLKFDLNTKVLDFRPFNQLPKNEIVDSYQLNTLSLNEFNKFKNVKEIIFDAVLSPVYYTQHMIFDIYSYHPIYNINYPHEQQPKTQLMPFFDNPLIFLPLVTEIKIYILPDAKSFLTRKINAGNGLRDYCDPITPFANLRSLPNLKKLYIINSSSMNVEVSCIHTLITKPQPYSEQQAINSGWKKDLKHIILKNINLTQDLTNLITNRNVKLEYIS